MEKTSEYIPIIDFSELTPEMYIGDEASSELCKEADTPLYTDRIDGFDADTVTWD